jgi:hypothetical protein
MAERNLSIDHVTIGRWVQRYAPVLNQRIRRDLRRPNRSLEGWPRRISRLPPVVARPKMAGLVA